jgi:3-oxoacyl-[acyl-carrier-protein] synthase-3
MYINTISYYLPDTEIPNSYFEKINGLSDDWIYSRTGIKRRRKAGINENTNTMAIESVKTGINALNYSLSDIDLIVGATYTPFDTIGTIAHAIQNHFNLNEVKALSISSACSSLINAIEIVQTYFLAGKSKSALIVASDHNTIYSDEKNRISGHLWGDGAVAIFLSKEKQSEKDMQVLEVVTRSLANIGHGPLGVHLQPQNGGLKMPHGRDVFIHACNYMSLYTKEVLHKQNYTIDQLDYLAPHQANIRIIKKVAEILEIDFSKVLINVDSCGNTGSPSAAIALAQNFYRIPPKALIAMTVFGGGYSTGAMLVRNGE